MKIFIFGLVIAFFVFKIGILSIAFGNSSKLGPIIVSKYISSAECLKVLNYGNIMEYPNLTLGKPFWIFIYEGKEWFIQKSETTINTGMSNNFSTNKYACHGAQVLITENWNCSKVKVWLKTKFRFE